MRKNSIDILSGSFRDPSGFLFFNNGILYRQINSVYKENYDFFIKSGLYNKLTDLNLLIKHNEVENQFNNDVNAYKIIRPEIIPFISYPYEWCFSQLKDAALITLEIQKIALKYKMTLKDASAYNIQFVNCKPVLIDTLSFEIYESGKPWIAYKQFCQHFLAPLALMAKTDIRLNQLLRIYIDGIPLDLTSKLLPGKTKFNLSLYAHIYLHSKAQKKHEKTIVYENSNKRYGLSEFSLLSLIDNLEASVRNLKWAPSGTEWGDYYDNTNYTNNAFKHKEVLVEEYIKKIDPKPEYVWDIGANTGMFSNIVLKKNIATISFDVDPAAIEISYLKDKKDKIKNHLQLICDLTNPSPDLGWANKERESLINRGPVDLVMALALIHHLAISNNIPLGKIAKFFSLICKYLIIEFIPKSDSKVKILLNTREDIFTNYDQQNMENEFKKYFDIKVFSKIKESERTLYLMCKKD